MRAGFATVFSDSIHPVPPLSQRPLRISVIGVGNHCRAFHLPALAQYQRAHPGVVDLASVVDPDRATAAAVAGGFGFGAIHADIDEMLAGPRPDACIAVTPVELNARVATQLAREGLPVLMEKPPAETIDEARRLVDDLARLDAKVMVSMNRRFDPLLRAALDWIGTRPIRRIQTTMTRQARTEPKFVEHTGLHVVDLVRAVGGEVRSSDVRRVNAGVADFFQARLAFASGATGLIDLMPTGGVNAEFLRLSGGGFEVEIRSAEFDRGGWCAWLDGCPERDESLARTTPMFVANGTLAETEAFLDAVISGRNFFPSPADVLPSMELCHLMEDAEKTPDVAFP